MEMSAFNYSSAEVTQTLYFLFRRPLVGSQICGKRLLAASSVRVLPSVRPSSWKNSALTEEMFKNFDIWVFFRISVEKNQVSLKYDKNNGYLI